MPNGSEMADRDAYINERIERLKQVARLSYLYMNPDVYDAKVETIGIQYSRYSVHVDLNVVPIPEPPRLDGIKLIVTVSKPQ